MQPPPPLISLHLPHQPSLTHSRRPPTLTLPQIASALDLPVNVAPALGGATVGASHPRHPLSRSAGLSRDGLTAWI
ncbi:hypothetical protein A2U01_0091862 [Trifolium medium]|uniref:Uncharacterized protein n=1 Tax=Trifolium medium TaxID=97028 RepID=A0A392UAQ4_9FABA|nr:hypothetical protein [Trifolium medium]